MAALRGSDGAFLLGEMAPHTIRAGRIYFPAGTPDPTDVFDGRVDLEASARRELLEETGVDASETVIAPGWTLVFTPHRTACMKLMTLAIPAAAAKERIDAHLARDPHAEFSRMHIVRSAREIDESRVPMFVAEYLRDALQ
jgi:8-oxo-dGTP pyrophosphatase MutT (NUDIX family)